MKGVTKDEAEAVKWFRKAAEQNNIGGQYSLGAA
jgi:TPR repeat protein